MLPNFQSVVMNICTTVPLEMNEIDRKKENPFFATFAFMRKVKSDM